MTLAVPSPCRLRRLAVAALLVGSAHAQEKPSLPDLFVNPYNKLSAHHRPVGAGVAAPIDRAVFLEIDGVDRGAAILRTAR